MAKAKARNKGKRFPALKAGAKMQEFEMAPGFSMGDNDGNRVNGGDKIMLSHAQAVFLQGLKAIVLSVPDFEGDEDDDADNTTETSTEPKADGGGNKSAGGASTKKPAL